MLHEINQDITITITGMRKTMVRTTIELIKTSASWYLNDECAWENYVSYYRGFQYFLINFAELAPPRPPLPGGELAPPRPPPPETDDEDEMFMHAPQPNQPIMVTKNGKLLINLAYSSSVWIPRWLHMDCIKKSANGPARTMKLSQRPRKWQF